MTGTCNFLAPWKNTWLSEREGPIIARPSCCNIFFSTIHVSSVAWQSAWSGSQAQAGVSEYLNSGRTMTSQSSCLKYFFHINNHTHLDMKKRAKMARLYKLDPVGSTVRYEMMKLCTLYRVSIGQYKAVAVGK